MDPSVYLVLTGFIPLRTLSFRPFLSSEHLRKVHFCTFLLKVAHLSGNSLGSSPTVKRVIIPGADSRKRERPTVKRVGAG